MKKKTETETFKVKDKVKFVDGSHGRIVKILDGKAIVKFYGDKRDYTINFNSLKKL